MVSYMIMQALRALKHASELEKKKTQDKRCTVELVCKWANLQTTEKLLNRKKDIGVSPMLKTRLSPLDS